MAECRASSSHSSQEHLEDSTGKGSTQKKAAHADRQTYQNLQRGKDSQKTGAFQVTPKAPRGVKPRKEWNVKDEKESGFVKMTIAAPLDQRIESLRDLSYYNDDRKKEIATAGFIYTGFGQIHENAVHCFSCDMGLTKISPNDDPWALHKIHSPECKFLKLMESEPAGSVTKEGSIGDAKQALATSGIHPDYVCKICNTNAIGAIYLPCGHACCLRQECVFKSSKCFRSDCREEITFVVPIRLDTDGEKEEEKDAHDLE